MTYIAPQKLGRRILRNPKAWAVGTGALVAIIVLSKVLDFPFAW